MNCVRRADVSWILEEIREKSEKIPKSSGFSRQNFYLRFVVRIFSMVLFELWMDLRICHNITACNAKFSTITPIGIPESIIGVSKIWEEYGLKARPCAQVYLDFQISNLRIPLLICTWFEKSSWTNLISNLIFTASHHLGISYYVNVLEGLGSNEFQLKWRQLKKFKSWGPFWSYQLNCTANSAPLAYFCSKWAGLAVLFSR